MAWIIILLIVVFLVIVLLIMPIHLRINTDADYIPEPDLFRLDIDLNGENLITVLLYVFFVRFTWHPFKMKIRQPDKTVASKRTNRFDLLNWNQLKFFIRVAWQSIKKSRLRKLYLDLDTRNVIINANLYPVFELMNDRPRVNLNINYSGNFALSLDLQDNLWNVIRIVLSNLLKRSFIFTKNK
jgi:hypothetical protein